MINDKNRYRGSLLAQSILKEKVTRTVTEDEMLETVNLDYRRLMIIQLVSICFWRYGHLVFNCPSTIDSRRNLDL